MAQAIKSIPTLKDEVAQHFSEMIEINNANANSIDFSKEKESAKQILLKAKF